MEHLNEGSEGKEISTSNEVPEQNEPSTEAMEDDSAELEAPQENTETTAPEAEPEEDVSVADDEDNQELQQPQNTETALQNEETQTEPAAVTEVTEENQPEPGSQDNAETKQEDSTDDPDQQELEPVDEEELPNEPKEYTDNDPNRYDDYTDEDFKQLEEEDPGYINGDVLDYDHPDYLSDGTHRVNWGEDSADTPHRETLEPGTRLSRVGDEDGRYLGDPDVEYNDRQLPTVEGKQPIHEYEVTKPLDVDQSTIAKQDWGPEMSNPDAQQYKTDKSIKELLDEGYLKEVPANDGTDWERTSLTPKQEAQIKEMDALGEIDIPQEDPDWQEPARKEGHLPTEKTGTFDGERGNSAFHPNDDAALFKMNEYGRDSVDYRDGNPDFSPFTQHDTPYGKMDGQVEIPHMTDNRENPSWEYGRRPDGTSHNPNYNLGNFAQADNALSEKMGNMTPEQVEDYRKNNNLTWHECPDGKTMQLVPTEIHDACRHSGGVSEQKYRQAMGDVTAPIGNVTPAEAENASQPSGNGERSQRA